MDTTPDIKIFQKRVANMIGSSTLRNQGEGSVRAARKYLKFLNLKEFLGIDKKKFNYLLNIHTKKLQKKITNKKWGPARKSLNIFLLQASLNYFLSKKYKLGRIIPYLEVPLDSNVYEGLKEDINRLKKENKLKGNLAKIKFPKWYGVKYLKPETSEIMQEFALLVAKHKKWNRAFLDLEYWRKK